MQFDTPALLYAFGLTLFAGLSTGIGSLMALMSRKFNPKFLAISLGFSAGVMIYVSLVEILAKSRASLTTIYDVKTGNWIALGAFFAGIGLIALIDRLVPSYENPHEMKNLAHPRASQAHDAKRLMRMGVFSALAISIHNFPEGLATFIGALHDPRMGVSIAGAIAIHNIPEGIAVSVPIYFATRSHKRAFLYSFASGLAEPIGALVGFFLLSSFFTAATFGIVFALIAGIMVYISLDELLPTAEEYGEHHLAIGGLVGGMAVMGVSLVLFL